MSACVLVCLFAKTFDESLIVKKLTESLQVINFWIQSKMAATPR